MAKKKRSKLKVKEISVKRVEHLQSPDKNPFGLLPAYITNMKINVQRQKLETDPDQNLITIHDAVADTDTDRRQFKQFLTLIYIVIQKVYKDEVNDHYFAPVGQQSFKETSFFEINFAGPNQGDIQIHFEFAQEYAAFLQVLQSYQETITIDPKK